MYKQLYIKKNLYNFTLHKVMTLFLNYNLHLEVQFFLGH